MASPPAPMQTSMTLANDPEKIAGAVCLLVEALESQAYETASVFAVRLAFEESVINAFRHGHCSCPQKPISVSWSVGTDEIELRITDEGPGFDPCCVPDPTLDENLTKPSGRGLMLMRAYMSEVQHNEQGNQVVMRYLRPAKLAD